jgi:hypothetical protein
MSDTLMIRPYPLQAGHPLNHGFVECCYCGTQIPQRTASAPGGLETLRFKCSDFRWCTEQARAIGRINEDAL